MLELRPYQREALDALHAYWQAGGGNGLIVLPTGAGKSLVIASLAQGLLAEWPNLRIGVVTHVKELIQQNAQELLRLWPGAPVGIYSAGLGRRDAHRQILFMGIQSVHQKAARLGDFDLLIVDEAHLIPRNADTMYGRFIAACRERVPDMRLVGLTATPYRLDSGRLDGGRGSLFDDVVSEANVLDLIKDGYLSPLRSKATTAEIDTSGVTVRAGEFVAGELEAAASLPEIVAAAVREVVERGADRGGWIAFCTGVAHAKLVRDEIRQHGISCEMVTGDMAAGERDAVIRAFKERRIRCLTSVGVLTTGFNSPHVDLIAMMRPTLSTGLYVQMVGRGFRTAPGKADCLVLDFAGNIRRHGPVDAVRPGGSSGAEGKKEGDGTKVKPDTVRAKVCPSCQELNALHVQRCANPHCGYEWPQERAKHQAKAEAAPILSSHQPPRPPEWVKVTRVSCARHQKMGKPDSLRVEYECGKYPFGATHREWLAFEAAGYARQKAGEIWRRLGGEHPLPVTAAEAMMRFDELDDVTEIQIAPDGQYTRVMARRTAPKAKPRTWYGILGVAPDAGKVEIERAFRSKAMKAHPDHGGSDAAMVELNAARATALKSAEGRP